MSKQVGIDKSPFSVTHHASPRTRHGFDHVEDYEKTEKPKPPIPNNIIEDYSEFDSLGSVSMCAVTEQEVLPGHAKILSESYDVPHHDGSSEDAH